MKTFVLASKIKMISQGNYLSILKANIEANLRTEISRYYLFYLWWVFDPILSMIIYYLVFGLFLRAGTPNFVGFLLVGVAHWQWFAKTVQNGSQSIYQGRGLMMNINIHKSFFPLVIVGRNTFKQLFVIILLLIFLIFYPTPVTICWVVLPLLMFIQLVLVAACTMLCAAFVPFLPDLFYLIQTGIHLMFFASGIFYDLDSLLSPVHRDIVYFLNPMAGLIKNYRNILIYGQWPDWSYIGLVGLFSMVFFCFSLIAISRFDHIYPKTCQQ